jgi:hypothetical protein
VARRWTRARQISLEKPADPLTAHCLTCRPRRSTIRTPFGWWCLVCSGCPRCGAHQVWEQIEVDDAGLFLDPLIVEGRPIRGDWWCLRCGEWLVKWTEYRRTLLGWKRGVVALAEGYRRREDAA